MDKTAIIVLGSRTRHPIGQRSFRCAMHTGNVPAQGTFGQTVTQAVRGKRLSVIVFEEMPGGQSSGIRAACNP